MAWLRYGRILQPVCSGLRCKRFIYQADTKYVSHIPPIGQLSFTPRFLQLFRYEGAVHSALGYFTILAALCLSALDIIGFGKRFLAFIRSGDKLTLRSFWTVVNQDREQHHDFSDPEYTGLVEDESEALEEVGPIYLQHAEEFGQNETQDHQHNHEKGTLRTSLQRRLTVIPSPQPESPNGTLCEPVYDRHDRPKVPLLGRIGKIAYAVAERLLVVAGFAHVVIGIVTYTGGCRDYYLPPCLGHTISM
jgi:hypothetical protein